MTETLWLINLILAVNLLRFSGAGFNFWPRISKWNAKGRTGAKNEALIDFIESG